MIDRDFSVIMKSSTEPKEINMSYKTYDVHLVISMPDKVSGVAPGEERIRHDIEVNSSIVNRGFEKMCADNGIDLLSALTELVEVNDDEEPAKTP